MATERINDLRAFKDFIEAKLTNDALELSPQEALALWDIENAPDEERAATIEAVREALLDMHAGDTGVSARDFVAETRRKYNLPVTS